MTAEELVAVWPERWPRPEPTTTRNAASQLTHFGRYFGVTPLQHISRSDFRRFAMAHPGAARYARTALNDAVDEGILVTNPGAGVAVKMPPKKKIVVPTRDDVENLAHYARGFGGPRFGQMIRVCAYTGLREGEARALTAGDIDIPRRRGRVEYSINREERLKEPKTPSSKAPFVIFDEIVGDLVDLVTAPLESPVRPGRLFPFTVEDRIRFWERARYDAKLDKVKFHGLRHFTATWLLDKGGVVEDVALQLRCTPEEIRRTYGHPDRDAALSRLAAL